MKLFKYQEEVLNQTKHFNRVGYFLDMGLGKTFVDSENLWKLNTQVNPLICQKSKVQDWVEHFNQYYGSDYSVCDLTKRKVLKAFDEFIKNGCDVVGVINYDLVFSRSYMVHITGFTLMFAGILATDTMFINIDDGLFTIRLDMERGDDNV